MKCRHHRARWDFVFGSVSMTLDANLANFVQADPARLANDARSILGFLKDRVGW